MFVYILCRGGTIHISMWIWLHIEAWSDRILEEASPESARRLHMRCHFCTRPCMPSQSANPPQGLHQSCIWTRQYSISWPCFYCLYYPLPSSLPRWFPGCLFQLSRYIYHGTLFLRCLCVCAFGSGWEFREGLHHWKNRSGFGRLERVCFLSMDMNQFVTAYTMV